MEQTNQNSEMEGNKIHDTHGNSYQHKFLSQYTKLIDLAMEVRALVNWLPMIT